MMSTQRIRPCMPISHFPCLGALLLTVRYDLYLSLLCLLSPHVVPQVLFSCGINVLQSLGFLLPSASGEILQDVFNK